MVVEAALQSSPPVIPPALKWVGWLFALTAAAVASWKFLFQRPRLELRAKAPHAIEKDGRLRSRTSFEVVNTGTSAAAEVYLEFELGDWNFTDPGDLEFSRTILDVDHLDSVYIGTGEINQLSIKNTIHAGTAFNLFTGEAQFERHRVYEVDYKIGCASYGPRSGTIRFDVGEDTVTVECDPPRFWRAWYQTLKTLNPVNWCPVKAHIYRKRVICSIEEKHNRERLVIDSSPWVFVEKCCPGPGVVTLSISVYDGDSNPENLIQIFRKTTRWLDPGDLWLPSYELYTPLDENHGLDEAALSTEWDVDYTPRTFSAFPKVDLSSELKHRVHGDAGVTQIKATLANHNVVEKRLWVLVKFTSKWGAVLETDHMSVRIPGGETKDFTITPNTDHEREKKIRGYKIQLSQSPS